MKGAEEKRVYVSARALRKAEVSDVGRSINNYSEKIGN